MPVYFFVKAIIGITTLAGSVLFSTGCSDGTDGLNSLTRITKVASGGECENFSGLKIEVGQDSNRNGALDDFEIDAAQTHSVCNQRVDGVASIVELLDLPMGGLVCPFGGIKVNSGLDESHDNVLQLSEVRYSKKVCHGKNGSNGQDGFSSSAKIIDVAIGTQGCAFGGKSIQVGSDTNRNGELDDGEVTGSNIICAVQVNKNKTLVKNSVINQGSVCENGGVLTEVGIDDNDNDILEPIEMDSSVEKCNVVNLVSGLNSLTKTTSASAGQCSFGGFVFKSGPDLNFNNFLENSEVSSNEIICNGVHGYDSIVEPTNYNGFYCGTQGGVKYEAGLDYNRDGLLSFLEVEKTSYICHGEDGLDGFDGFDGYNSLIVTSDAGSACGIDGGIYLESGLDLDEDDFLDFSEVENSEVICNGLPGLNSLVETYEDFLYCFDGGVVIETGLDLDEDGLLDEVEIENTTYICR